MPQSVRLLIMILAPGSQDLHGTQELGGEFVLKMHFILCVGNQNCTDWAQNKWRVNLIIGWKWVQGVKLGLLFKCLLGFQICCPFHHNFQRRGYAWTWVHSDMGKLNIGQWHYGHWSNGVPRSSLNHCSIGSLQHSHIFTGGHFCHCTFQDQEW